MDFTIRSFVGASTLFDAFLSDPGNLLDLVLALPKDNVPGFRFKKPVLLKDTRVTTDLIIFVDLGKAEEGGKSVNNAARLLAQKHPDWGLQASSIRQRYYRLKKAGPELERVLRLLSLLGERRSTSRAEA